MSFDVRDVGLDDVDDLQVLLETVPDYSQRVTGLPPGASDALSTLLQVPPDFDASGKRDIAAWDDGLMVAFADFLLGYPDESYVFLGLLVVRADRQRCGAGRRLHDVVIQRVVQESAATRLRLGIVETNADQAEPFWRALGYEPTGEVKPYRYDNLNSTVALWEHPITRPEQSNS